MTSNSPQISIGLLVGLISFGIAIIVALNVLFLSDTSRDIVMSSEESQAFSALEDNLRFIVDESNVATIYGTGAQSEITLSSSIFKDSTSDKSIELKFNDNQSITINNIGTSPNTVKLSVTLLESGIYHGLIFIVNNTNDDQEMIPFTVDIKPKITQPIMLVVDGIVISIALWKLLKYFNGMYGAIVIDNIKIASSSNTRRGFREYLDDRKATNITIFKNGILDIGTIIFGIALGIIALFNDPFVLGVHTLGPLDKIILIGMGLGIGSLKEFITNS